MEMTTSLAAWLVLAVSSAGVLSWFLTRHGQRSDLRREQAERLLRALNRYSEWVHAQRLAVVFQGEGVEAAAALDTACTIRLAWFPELAGDMAELLAVHNRLLNFLGTQQALWLRDPERWLESEHDKRFLALRRQHGFAMEALLDKLQRAARVRIAFSETDPRSRTTYA